MKRIVIFFTPLLVALDAIAHPGHPTLQPNHTHGPHEIDPLLGLIALVGAIGVFLVGRAISRRTFKKS